MDRRQLLASAAGVAIGGICPAVATAATKPKIETLPNYLLRITPKTADDPDWETTIYRLETNKPQLLHYKRSELWVGNEGEWITKHYIKTEEGPKRIDPSTLELIPFTPVDYRGIECH